MLNLFLFPPFFSLKSFSPFWQKRNEAGRVLYNAIHDRTLLLKRSQKFTGRLNRLLKLNSQPIKDTLYTILITFKNVKLQIICPFLRIFYF